MQVLVGCLSLSMLLRPPLPHARISCITRCPPILSCDSSAAFPDLTLEKLRTTSMDDLEELVEEMEAELANVKDASGVVDIQLSRLLAVAHTCYGDSDIAEEHATAVLEAGEPDAEMLFVRGLAAERRDAQDEALDAYEANRAVRLRVATRRANALVAAWKQDASRRVLVEADHAFVARRGLGVRRIGARRRRRRRGGWWLHRTRECAQLRARAHRESDLAEVGVGHLADGLGSADLVLLQRG